MGVRGKRFFIGWTTNISYAASGYFKTKGKKRSVVPGLPLPKAESADRKHPIRGALGRLGPLFYRRSSVLDLRRVALRVMLARFTSLLCKALSVRIVDYEFNS